MPTDTARTKKMPQVAEDTLADGLWTVVDVAELLKLSTSTVSRMACRNEIPSVKLGGSRRYQPAAIRRYVARLA
jgi:excisionase family DNA binding protein